MKLLFLLLAVPFAAATSTCKTRSSVTAHDGSVTVLETEVITAFTTVDIWTTEWVTARELANHLNKRELVVPFTEYDDENRAIFQTTFTLNDQTKKESEVLASAAGDTHEFTFVDSHHLKTYSTKYVHPGKRQTAADMPWCDEMPTEGVAITTIIVYTTVTIQPTTTSTTTTIIVTASHAVTSAPLESSQATATHAQATPASTLPTNCITTPTPWQAGMAGNCNKFYSVTKSEGCDKVASKNGIAESLVKEWNPGAGPECLSLSSDHFACVGTASCLTTPAPIQTNMATDCDKWYKLPKGEGCNDVARKNGINETDLRSWNPDAGPECSNLYVDYYACVHTTSCVWRCPGALGGPAEPATGVPVIVGPAPGSSESPQPGAAEPPASQIAPPASPGSSPGQDSPPPEATAAPPGTGEHPAADVPAEVIPGAVAVGALPPPGAAQSGEAGQTSVAGQTLSNPSTETPEQSGVPASSGAPVASEAPDGVPVVPVVPVFPPGAGPEPMNPGITFEGTSPAPTTAAGALPPNSLSSLPPASAPTEALPISQDQPTGAVPPPEDQIPGDVPPPIPPPILPPLGALCTTSGCPPLSDSLSLAESLPASSPPTGTITPSPTLPSGDIPPSATPSSDHIPPPIPPPVAILCTTSGCPLPPPPSSTLCTTPGCVPWPRPEETDAPCTSPDCAGDDDGSDGGVGILIIPPCIPCLLPKGLRWLCKLVSLGGSKPCPPVATPKFPFPIIFPPPPGIIPDPFHPGGGSDGIIPPPPPPGSGPGGERGGGEGAAPPPPGPPPGPPPAPPGGEIGGGAPTSPPPDASPSPTPSPSDTESPSESSCTDKTAMVTTMGCYRNGTSTSCSPYGTQTITGCEAVDTVTSHFCSMNTVTDVVVFCANGTAPCTTTSTVSSFTMSGCDLVPETVTAWPSDTSESSETCSDQTATVTTVSCHTNSATTSCTQVGTQITVGCSATGATTTQFCSLATVTDATVFCASGVSGSCSSTSTVATSLVSGCDVTASTTTSFAPACPAQITLSPDDDQGEAGGSDDFLPPFSGHPLQCADNQSSIRIDTRDDVTSFYSIVHDWCTDFEKQGMSLDTANGTHMVYTVEYTYDNKSTPNKIFELVFASNDQKFTLANDRKKAIGACTDAYISTASLCRPAKDTSGNTSVGGCQYFHDNGFGVCINLYELVSGTPPPVYSGPFVLRPTPTPTPSWTTTRSWSTFPSKHSLCTKDCSTGRPEPMAGKKPPLSDWHFRVYGYEVCWHASLFSLGSKCEREWVLMGSESDSNFQKCNGLVKLHPNSYREKVSGDKPIYPKPKDPKERCDVFGLWNDDPLRETYRLPTICDNANSIKDGPGSLTQCVVWSRAKDPLHSGLSNSNFDDGVYLECREGMSCCVPDDGEDYDCLDIMSGDLIEPVLGDMVETPVQWKYLRQLKCHKDYCYQGD